MKIRNLRADEIECRVQTIRKDGCSLLLYKDARADMKILDETFGVLGWEREHQIIGNNLYCTVRVWDQEKVQWISKQDVGTESYAEAEKGQASDSFKRACVNLGIGRELYTGPFIWVFLNPGETYENNGRVGLDRKVGLKVGEIEYNEENEIIKLVIVDSNGKARYTYREPGKVPKGNTPAPKQEPQTEKAPAPSPEKNGCIDCNKELTPGEETYSTKHYGKHLCFNCQKNHPKINQ